MTAARDFGPFRYPGPAVGLLCALLAYPAATSRFDYFRVYRP